MPKFFSRRTAGPRMVLAAFLGLILVGTLLLMLPISTMQEGGASFLDALFTATSAVCVTGLIVQNTATFWSPFGKAVILLLIQLGGLGVLTSVFFVSFVADKDASVVRRNIIKDAISAPQIGGILKLGRFILAVTLAVEAIGALILVPVLIHYLGFADGLTGAIFHSVSAFCNAGIDILPGQAHFSSIALFRTNAPVMLVTSALIIIGGIGFLTWDDVRNHGLAVKRYRFQTKLVLVGTVVLIVLPFLYFFFIENKGVPIGERFLLAWFEAVTPRTAGFATADYGRMSESGQLLTIALMLIGGSSGSTAGGIKVTTLMVVILATMCVIDRRKETVAFNRRIEPEIVRTAFALFAIYVMLLFVGTIVMSGIEHIPVISALFECASALATVGLSTGITPTLGIFSKLMLIGFMYFGRVGGLTLAYAVSHDGPRGVSRHVSERVSVG